MKVWVDADACPAKIKEIISRAVHKRAVETCFVANKPIALAESPYLKSVLVGAGPDIADEYIATHATSGDLVVTQDIPLASQLVPQGIVVISPRGDLFDENNIHESKSRRDLMQSLRDQGTITGGPAPFDEKNKREFANHFDAALQRLNR